MDVLIYGGAGLLVFGLVVWAGTHMVRRADGSGGGMADGLGGMIDVFDPGAGRAQRDIKSKEHEGEIMPAPEDDKNRPVRIDPILMRATIKRPKA